MKIRLADYDAVTTLTYCPICGHKLDRATCVSRDGESADPKPGDATVCIDCAGWLIFNKDLSLRKMDHLDIRDLTPEQHLYLMAVTKVVKKVHQ